MRTILHLDADAFFASAEQSFNPLLRNKPVIVGGFAHHRGCVHTASYEARRRGVKTAMSLKEAKEICPDAIFLKGDFRHYYALGKTISKILHSFSPDVEVSSLDDAYIDLTNVLHLYDSAEDVAKSIQNTIKNKAGMPVSIGIGSSKLIARIASGLNKPRGITNVEHGKEVEFLSRLPILKLRGIGWKTESILKEHDIATIGDIANIGKESLVQWLGNAAGESIWEFAHAKDDRPVLQRRISTQISRETSFEEDIDDPKILKGTILYLIDRVAMKLRKEEWTARQVYLKVRFADGSSQKQSRTLRRHTDDGNELSETVLAMYNGFPERRIRVKLVGVRVSELQYRYSQKTIFDAVERREELNLGIDDIRRRFGFTSLLQGSTLVLSKLYKLEKHGYILHTPALSQ